MNTSPGDMHDRDRELARRAREIHAQACAGVDARMHAQLAAARRNALLAAGEPLRKRVWLPAGGAIAACALAVGVILWRPAAMPSTVQTRQIAANETELPLDADAKQIDLYQNLEFYQWLAQQPDAHPTSDGAPQ